MLASTVKSLPKNLPIVRALAGDSTITSDFPAFFSVAFAMLEDHTDLNHNLHKLRKPGIRRGSIYQRSRRQGISRSEPTCRIGNTRLGHPPQD